MTKISNQYSLTNILTADLANSRLGINNVSPTVALDVTGAGKFSSSVTATTFSSVNSTPQMDFVLSANTAFKHSIVASTFSSSPISANILDFRVANGANSQVTVMNLTGAGNVGIGTTSPTAKLEVIGYGTANSIMTYVCAKFYGAGTGGINIGTDGTNPQIATDSSGVDLTFLTRVAGTFSERMRITSGGSLLMAKDAVIGINTVDGSDNGYLALCGAGADGENRGGHIYLSGNERSADPGTVVLSAGNVIGVGSVIAFRTAGVERMRLIGNGRLLIGTSTDQGYMLFVNGNAAGTSGFANVSDRRLKKDIIPIESALNKVKLLNGVSFNWDKTLRPDLNVDDNNHLGLIAQDVETILPQVVTTGDDEFNTKTIIYSDIVPVLIEAIKELSAKVSLLENK